ncbi:MAG: acyltransferase [Pedobacter sp.]|nr:MAG: acyltransferase [Pedobacter sp.]
MKTRFLYWALNVFHKFRKIKIGRNCKIHFSCKLSLGFAKHAPGDLILADDVEFCKGVVIKCYGGNIHLNKNVFLGEYVIIYGHGGVEIGENTLIAMHTCIVSSNHTIPDKNTLIRSQPDILLPVSIGKDVWIGAGVKILGGVKIGNGCVVGAGSVVTKDLPEYSICFGVPAVVKKYRH